MENRHRILLGFDTEIFRSVASETAGSLTLLPRAKRRPGFTPTTLGGDKGFFSVGFIEALLGRGIEPHIAVDTRGRQPAHARVRMRARGLGYRLSQRARKKLEELFGEGKDWHGSRRFRRRGLLRVRQETHLIGWVLNLIRLAALLPQCSRPQASVSRKAPARPKRRLAA